jgi:hypothetical protein
MTFKPTLLAALSTSIILGSGNTSIDNRLQELYKARDLKLIELVERGSVLEKKAMLLADYNEYAVKYLTDKSQNISDSRSKELYLKKALDEFNNFNKRALHALSEKNVKGFMKQEKVMGVSHDEEFFNFLYFKLFTHAANQYHLRILLEYYEACLQELLDIDSEIEILQANLSQ